MGQGIGDLDSGLTINKVLPRDNTFELLLAHAIDIDAVGFLHPRMANRKLMLLWKLVVFVGIKQRSLAHSPVSNLSRTL